MFPGFVLSLREGLEAALVIGIALGVLRKMQRADLYPAIWWGAASAALVSLLAAGLLTWIGAKFEGRAEELFEGAAMLLAAGLLTWMIFWMQRQSSRLRGKIEADVQRAVSQSGGQAMFLLAFLAVGREGLELALFLVAAGVGAGGLPVILGAAAGLGAAAALGWMLFATTRRLNLKQFFLVTNILLLLFAAGLVAHGVHEFNEAGLLPALVEHVWDTNAILDENSGPGQLLKALFGYNGNPSLTEVGAYLFYIGLLLFALRRAAPPLQPQTA